MTWEVVEYYGEEKALLKLGVCDLQSKAQKSTVRQNIMRDVVVLGPLLKLGVLYLQSMVFIE